MHSSLLRSTPTRIQGHHSAGVLLSTDPPITTCCSQWQSSSESRQISEIPTRGGAYDSFTRPPSFPQDIAYQSFRSPDCSQPQKSPPDVPYSRESPHGRRCPQVLQACISEVAVDPGTRDRHAYCRARLERQNQDLEPRVMPLSARTIFVQSQFGGD